MKNKLIPTTKEESSLIYEFCEEQYKNMSGQSRKDLDEAIADIGGRMADKIERDFLDFMVMQSNEK